MSKIEDMCSMINIADSGFKNVEPSEVFFYVFMYIHICPYIFLSTSNKLSNARIILETKSFRFENALLHSYESGVNN